MRGSWAAQRPGARQIKGARAAPRAGGWNTQAEHTGVATPQLKPFPLLHFIYSDVGTPRWNSFVSKTCPCFQEQIGGGSGDDGKTEADRVQGDRGPKERRGGPLPRSR